MRRDVTTPKSWVHLNAETNSSRRRLVASASVIGILSIALIAALSTGNDLSPVTSSVESASTSGSSFLRDLSVALPIGYAFGAGMVAAVNPCGFALLPAYLGLYLGDTQDVDGGQRLPRVGRALLVGLSVTAGFVILFGVTGLILGSITTSLTSAFPWIGLVVGVGLVILAGRTMMSETSYGGFGGRMSAKVSGAARGRNAAGYFAYGIGYGLASLSCTLPIFLALAGGTLTTGSLVSSISEFILYGLGMGFVVTALTLTVAFFKLAAVQRVRELGRFVQPISSVLLLTAGGYLVYYWLTIGGVLSSIH